MSCVGLWKELSKFCTEWLVKSDGYLSLGLETYIFNRKFGVWEDPVSLVLDTLYGLRCQKSQPLLPRFFLLVLWFPQLYRSEMLNRWSSPLTPLGRDNATLEIWQTKLVKVKESNRSSITKSVEHFINNNLTGFTVNQTTEEQKR